LLTGIARHQAELGAEDARRQWRPAGTGAGQHGEEVARQLDVAAVVPLGAALEAMPLDPAAVVVVDRQLVLVPVEAERAAIADERRAARGGAAAGVEVLGVDGVRAVGVLDDCAGRVVIAGIDREAAEPVVRLDGRPDALKV
jgi:hypothetical protein